MIPFDVKSPLSSDFFSQIFAVIRSIKQQFKERFTLDHNMNDVLDTALPTADGYHNQITMPEYIEYDNVGIPSYSPTHLSDSNQIFVKKIDGLHELCVSNDEGIYQITRKGGSSYFYIWGEVSTPYRDMWGLAYGDGVFVSCGSNGRVYTSIDGITWTKITIVEYDTTVYNSVEFINNIFILCGGSGKVYQSPDGSTWSTVSLATSYDVKASFYYSGTYIISTVAGYGLKYSSDLITWNTIPSDLHSFYKIIYAFGVVIGVGSHGIIRTATDVTTTWTKRLELSWTDPVYDSFYGVAASSSIAVAVGKYGKIYTSYDGLTWTKRTSGLTETDSSTLHDIIYAGGNINKFCAIGMGGIILISSDGINWERVQVSSLTEDLRSISTDGTKYLIVGVTNAISPKKVTT